MANLIQENSLLEIKLNIKLHSYMSLKSLFFCKCIEQTSGNMRVINICVLMCSAQALTYYEIFNMITLGSL